MLDLLVTNGTVLTMDPAHPVARVVGVLHGRVVGLDDDVAGLGVRRVLDLDGGTAVPGFVDAHNHLTWAGLDALAADASDCRTVEAVLEVVRRAAAATAGDRWVDVVGYDQRALPRHLTRHDLDGVAPGRRVRVAHHSGHLSVVSSPVVAGLPAVLSPAAAAGVVRDDDGEPTGVFSETAHELVRAQRLPYSLEEIADALAATAAQCLAEGVTMAAEAGIGTGLIGHGPVEFAAYQLARDTGRLPIRAQVMVGADVLRAVHTHPGDGVRRAMDLGIRTGLGDDRLSIGALKLWLDGGMSTRTAALSEPYASGGLGQLADRDATIETVVDAHEAGWQLALHAIGDRALDLALDAVEAAQRAAPRRDARHRIEHAGLVRPDQLSRMAAADLTAVVQPSFLVKSGDDYAAQMGDERAPWLYRGRAFLDAGIALAGSSDRPVADGAPLKAAQFMVERRSSSRAPIGPDEAISVGEALAAYTTGSARACRLEGSVGRLSPGLCADLAVLDADPRVVPADQLGSIRVLRTLVGGEVVHGPAL